jgi:hypothetical protein
VYEEETRARSRLGRLGWALLLLLTAGAIGWYAVNNVEPLKSAWADFRGEKPPTWADVGNKIQEFMDQQPIVMPRTEPAPPAPPPPAMTPTP